MDTDEKNKLQETALRRCIFNKHGLKYKGWQNISQGFPQPQQFIDLGFAILTSEIFSGEGLKGSTHNYPIRKDDLLFRLIWVALNYDVSILGDDDTVLYLDKYFEWIVRIAHIAQLGTVLEKRINSLWQDCRKKLLARVLEGKAPHPGLTSKKPAKPPTKGSSSGRYLS